MHKIYKVYLIRDKRTDEIKYVGLTRQTLETRFSGHCQRRKISRAHYGMELVRDELTQIEAVALEKLLIAQYDLLKTGWNKSPGSIDGSSQYHSEEQKEKWRKERPGTPVSPEHAEKNKTARLGKKNSEYHKKMVSEKKSRPVICLETGVVYKSGRHAAKELSLNTSKISLVCNGKRSTTGGLHFAFAETVETNRND